MAMALFAGGRRFPSPARRPSPILVRRCSNVLQFFKQTQPDTARAAKLAQEISTVLREGPPEVAMAKARGLVAELAKICRVPTLEARLSSLEVTVNTDRKIAFGLATMFFAASLMGIPATVYKAKIDSEHEISELKSKIASDHEA